ncbi:hypothetical protein ABZX40_36470 [Streptomyces sp. NPDC004610]|uniref:hypothetical protein n=1 Tax=unclassified Streptomyces TaxID=2593676 RepID=UPI0033BB4538
MYHPIPRPAAPNGPGHCPRCHCPVIWCVTAANRVPLAVDRDRDPGGNQAVRQDHTGRWLTRQLTTERPTTEAAEALHRPHIATCPTPAPRTARPTTGGRRSARPTTWPQR